MVSIVFILLYLFIYLNVNKAPICNNHFSIIEILL